MTGDGPEAMEVIRHAWLWLSGSNRSRHPEGSRIRIPCVPSSFDRLLLSTNSSAASLFPDSKFRERTIELEQPNHGGRMANEQLCVDRATAAENESRLQSLGVFVPRDAYRHRGRWRM